jgi:hypothetical protein
MDRWESTPRLAFLSPEPGSGKSRALEISSLLVPNPVMAVNVSPAYLFRKVGGEETVTLLYDEIDAVFGPKARENEEIRALLNAGHRKGAVAGRCVVRGKIIETEDISAYAAVALAGLGGLPDTIMTRSVVIRMRRRHDGERVEPYRSRIHGREGYRIRDAIAVWARSAKIDWPKLPEEIQDRDADVWEPLIAIADAIGEKWSTKARVAAVSLVTAAQEAETSLGVRLLTDLRTVFKGEDELTSKTILDRLIALPESPWGDLRGKPLDERKLARLLRPYEVKPKVLRTSAGTLRGYSKADLEDQWRRYLSPSPAKGETSETSETTAAGGTIEPSVSDVSDVSLLSGKRGEQCDHCRGLGELVPDFHYGDANPRLHKHCIKPWVAKYDAVGDIPPFLDRRGELSTIVPSSDANFDEGLEHEAPTFS